MPKRAISVTLDEENLTWLRGRVRGGGLRSVSELLDRIVTEARAAGRTGPTRSVVGTIQIDPDDPLLEQADTAVRLLFESSVSRPMRADEAAVEYRLHRLRRRARKKSRD